MSTKSDRSRSGIVAGQNGAAPLDVETPFSKRRAGLIDRLVWSSATTHALPPRWRKIIRKRFGRERPGPFDVAVDGICFRTYPTENRCDRIIVGRQALPEGEEHMLLKPFVGKGMVFVDIGANIGTYALWAARLVGPKGKVIALEPHPRTYAKLKFNCLANGAANVLPLNLAAGGEEATAVLRFDGGGNIGNASMLAPESDRAGVEVAIRTSPLNVILETVGFRPDVIKIDVEGFEDRALLPFYEETEPSAWPRTVMIETALKERWETDCITFLVERGYARKAATRENVILQRGSSSINGDRAASGYDSARR